MNNAFVDQLKNHVHIKTVCPEVEIGLGVPRLPIKLVRQKKEGLGLMQTETNQDLTQSMNDFASDYVAGLEEVDGFILKSRSPSCAVGDAKVVASMKNPNVVSRGPGLFTVHVLEKYGHLAVEDEGRLSNFKLREHFLTKIFLLARWRGLKKTFSRNALVDFHADHKLIWMAFSQKKLKEMGRIVAEQKGKDRQDVINAYEEKIYDVLQKPFRMPSVINVLMHGLGYFSKHLKRAEKKHFLDLLEDFRQKKLPLSAINHLLYSWALRFEEEYILRQRFFLPFPKELIDQTDSGKNRF